MKDRWASDAESQTLDLFPSLVPQQLVFRNEHPSIAIGLDDQDGTQTWLIEVEVITQEGIRRLGKFTTIAPNAAGDTDRSRIVAIAQCPGAKGWIIQIRPTAFGTSAASARLSVTGEDCCSGTAALTVNPQFATGATPPVLGTVSIASSTAVDGSVFGVASLGQKTMALSFPVVIASNQSAIPVTGALTLTGAKTPADGYANPNDAVDTLGLNELWNGARASRRRRRRPRAGQTSSRAASTTLPQRRSPTARATPSSST
jgi:hypothetical protein